MAAAAVAPAADRAEKCKEKVTSSSQSEEAAAAAVSPSNFQLPLNEDQRTRQPSGYGRTDGRAGTDIGAQGPRRRQLIERASEQRGGAASDGIVVGEDDDDALS